jgi:hypothetical protein
MPQLTPDRDGDSLFVPEVADSPRQRNMSVPVAVMQAMPAPASTPFVTEQVLTPKSPMLVPAKMECDEEQVLPFVQKLRDLEGSAKAEMAAWDPKFSQVAEESTGTAVGAKRKGMVLNRKGSHVTKSAAASEMDSDSSGDDGQADDDDREDEVPPLDPHSQKRPRLPIYHPGFKLTEKLALGTLSIFAAFIKQAKKNGYEDDELSYLSKQIEGSSTIPYQDAVKLAVSGDTGAGKSALLNAILGVPNLTIEVRESIRLSEHQLTSFPERRRRCVYLRHHRVPAITLDSRCSFRR